MNRINIGNLLPAWNQGHSWLCQRDLSAKGRPPTKDYPLYCCPINCLHKNYYRMFTNTL
ncbi:MAG: hypothetical protein LBK82_06005 [Planctomycetaceae bacterium]|nr:hypothetical protein [Planctomycetaceae bacterium]